MKIKIILFCLVLFAFHCNNYRKEPKQILFEEPLSSPSTTDTLKVGTPIKIEIQDLKEGENYWIISQNSLSQSIQKFNKKPHQKSIFLTQEMTYKKGLLKVEIFNSQQKVQEKTYYLRPIQKIAKIENYFGQKFVNLELSTDPQIISLLLDKYDNTSNPNYSLVYILNQEQQTKVKKLNQPINVAIFEDSDISKTGTKKVSIYFKNIYSEEETYYITSGFAQNFKIRADLNHHLADGNSQYTIKTNVLKDKKGNILQDGNMVIFSINNNNTQYSVQATTINGVAETKLLHLDSPGKITIMATCKPYAKSNSIELNFEHALKNIPYQKTKKGIKVGPIATFYGNYVAENTMVYVQLENIQNHTKTYLKIPSSNGFVNIQWPANMKSGEYSVQLSCLGFIAKPFKIDLK